MPTEILQIFYAGTLSKKLVKRLLKEKFIQSIEPGEIKTRIVLRVDAAKGVETMDERGRYLEHVQYTYQKAIDFIIASWDDRFYVRWINYLMTLDFFQKRIRMYQQKKVESKRQEIRGLMKEINENGGLYQPSGHSSGLKASSFSKK